MRLFLISLLITLLVACNKPNPKELIIGTIAGPETELALVAKAVALKKYGLMIRIVEFNDYNLPNEALQDGSLDANIYQHLPYLKAAIKTHHYNFMVLGKTFIYPTGIYSKKFKSLDELPVHALIGLPNDPSNEARALLLLEKAKLITLKTSNATTLAAIATNPKHLVFKEMDAAQLPHVLTDVDLAIIATTFALPAGLDPKKDALIMEDNQSPYTNLIVIRRDSQKKKQLQAFVKAFNAVEVKDKARLLFGNAAIAAW